MNIEEMTTKEIRDFLYKKEKEENSIVLKTGTLKEDLYCFESLNREDSSIFIVNSQFLTEKMKNETIKDFKNSFKLLYKKGIKVDFRPNGIWYINNYPFANIQSENTYVENIQEVK